MLWVRAFWLACLMPMLAGASPAADLKFVHQGVERTAVLIQPGTAQGPLPR